MIPGEFIIDEGVIEFNKDLKKVSVKVANLGDRPIQVGSHYHFFEVNPALSFSREEAYGMHLDIVPGTAIRFEPGLTRTVTLVPFLGKREVYGFRSEINGKLEDKE
ncbi:MAG: urease subunit beta [Succinivibrionaceae bacterium]